MNQTTVLFISLFFYHLASAAVVHVDHPTYPGTPLPFIVNIQNDETSLVCAALGYGLSLGGTAADYSNIDQTGVRVQKLDTTIALYMVMGPHDWESDLGSQINYRIASQIDCQDKPTSPTTLQKLKYITASDVQLFLKSTLPVHFDNNVGSVVIGGQTIVNPADNFCRAQGYDRAGTLYTTDGTANEGSPVVINQFNVDGSGNFVIEKQKTDYAQSVVCSNDVVVPAP
jgi:hypothetical protein